MRQAQPDLQLAVCATGCASVLDGRGSLDRLRGSFCRCDHKVHALAEPVAQNFEVKDRRTAGH